MKIYELTDSSGDYETPNTTIGYFSSLGKAEEAKKNVEEYNELRQRLNEAIRLIALKFQAFRESYIISPPMQPPKIKKHDGNHLAHLVTIRQKYERDGNSEMAHQALIEYQDKCEFNKTVNIKNREILDLWNIEYREWDRIRSEAFEATLTETEVKIRNYPYNIPYHEPFNIAEIEVDDFIPMNISELKEIL